MVAGVFCGCGLCGTGFGLAGFVGCGVGGGLRAFAAAVYWGGLYGLCVAIGAHLQRRGIG